MIPFAFWKSSSGASLLAPYSDPYVELWFRPGFSINDVMVTNPRGEQVSIAWTLFANPEIFYDPTPDPLVLSAGGSGFFRIQRSLNANGIGSVEGVWTGAVSGATGNMPTLYMESEGSTPTP
jgi:hypothetical protein